MTWLKKASVVLKSIGKKKMRGKISTIVMERETRLELATICLEGRSSSQLSYSRKIHKKFYIFTSKLYSFNLKSTLIFTPKKNSSFRYFFVLNYILLISMISNYNNREFI